MTEPAGAAQRTGAQALAQATRALTEAQVPDPGRDARRLLAHVLKVPAGRLTLFQSDPVSPEIAAAYDALVQQRCARVPVSHLTGWRQFYGRDFLVTSDVLDPRPETETLIAAALAAPFTRLLDLGTGSGCILLTLLSERPQARGLGIDLSPGALDVASRNRTALQLEGRAALEQGSWFTSIADRRDRFDLIVSNPPYIAASEMAGLTPEVRDHEPSLALTDGADGLSAYRIICAGAPRHLAPGGRLMVEIGPTQAAAVSEMMHTAGLDAPRVIPDLDGRDRVVWARMPQYPAG